MEKDIKENLNQEYNPILSPSYYIYPDNNEKTLTFEDNEKIYEDIENQDIEGTEVDETTNLCNKVCAVILIILICFIIYFCIAIIDKIQNL